MTVFVMSLVDRYSPMIIDPYYRYHDLVGLYIVLLVSSSVSLTTTFGVSRVFPRHIRVPHKRLLVVVFDI